MTDIWRFMFPGAGFIVEAMRRYVPAEGRRLQAFCFALDPSPGQLLSIVRHFGARRFAHNWAVERLIRERADYDRTGVSGERTS